MVNEKLDRETTEYRHETVKDTIYAITCLVDNLDELWDEDPWIMGGPSGEKIFWRAIDALKHLRDDVLDDVCWDLDQRLAHWPDDMDDIIAYDNQQRVADARLAAQGR